MEVRKSKVYILLDSEGRILVCDGGYTEANITEPEKWLFLDEGTGDRYNLCQAHYFDGGIYTSDGICRWKYTDGQCLLRDEAEIEYDREHRPEPPDELADAKAALSILGVT